MFVLHTIKNEMKILYHVNTFLTNRVCMFCFNDSKIVFI